MDYKVTSAEDVEMFLDKIYDPTFEVPRILVALGLEENEVNILFIHKLLMKSYRLGKDHAYATAIKAVKRE